jgi:hypothetical protein
MSAKMAAYGDRVSKDLQVDQPDDARKGLLDSWFNWPKPTSVPPPRRSTPPPAEPLDDGLADAWFR